MNKDKSTCSSGLSARWTARSSEWTLGDVGGGGVGDSIASILFSVYLAAQDAEACSSMEHGASAQQAGPLHTCSVPPRERRPVPFLLPTFFSGPADSAVPHSPSVFGGGRPGGSASQAVSLAISPLRIGGMEEAFVLSRVSSSVVRSVPRPPSPVRLLCTHWFGQGPCET